jgi:hypothetical protein
MAVGSSVSGSGQSVPLAQHWDGKSWVSTPVPPPASGGILFEVSCTSAVFCMALGNDGLSGNYAPIVYRWNGTSWSGLAEPSSTGSLPQLLGVSCTSSSACTAVGSSNDGSKPFAEGWNGKAWTVESTASTGLAVQFLYSVSCSSATSCVAVGTAENQNLFGRVLVERWNGVKWSILATPPVQSTGYGAELSDVVCPSATQCVAVGENTNSAGQQVTLAEAWNGTSWAVVSTPNPSDNQKLWPGAELLSLSCPSLASCVAVGGYVNQSDVSQALVERWNGTVWATAPAPPEGKLDGVACASPAACTIVGSSLDYAGNPVTAAWRANATSWARQPTTNPVGEVKGSLSGISCVSAAVCSTVGKAGGSVLAERWNGTGWSVDRTPNPAPGATLDAVSCPSATTCVAVGSYTTNAGHTVGLAELRNATGQWSQYVVPSPSGATWLTMTAVSCASPTSCMAVGTFTHGNQYSPPSMLAESWNGQRWTIEAAAVPPNVTISELYGVSCPAPTFCEAVGSYFDPTGPGADVALAERWDGAGWTVEHAAGFAYKANWLYGVSCLSATSCVAVGAQYDPAGTVNTNTLVEVRVGSRWSLQPSAGNTNLVDILNSVSCRSTIDCTAVGSTGNDGPDSPFAEGWDGTAWKLQAMPQPPSYVQLNGVACPEGTCLAVGSVALQPLVLRQ